MDKDLKNKVMAGFIWTGLGITVALPGMKGCIDAAMVSYDKNDDDTSELFCEGFADIFTHPACWGAGTVCFLAAAALYKYKKN